MARAINVIMEVETEKDGKKEFSVNNDGLVSLTFERYLGNLSESQVISKAELTVFDKSGHKVLSIIQGNKGKLRFKYGFEDNMSDTFELSIVRLNSTYNNLGCMVSMGAVGSQVMDKFPAELYVRGTPVENILIEMAQRNGWNIGDKYTENGKTKYYNIDCDLLLPWEIFKEADESDYEFISNKILPLANMSVTISSANYSGKFWDARLFDKSSSVMFYFKPYINTSNGTHRDDIRIWKYSYGTSEKSRVIRLTNTVNYSFLLNGLTIKVPSLALETLDEGVVTKEYLEDMVFNRFWKTIEGYFSEYHLPVPAKDEFRFNAEIVPVEESNLINVESIVNRVILAIKNAIMSLNSIELVVEGNTEIMPTDMIELEVMNRPDDNIPDDGNKRWNIVSGVWKVVKIKEEIGMSGFTTTLSLVRNNLDIKEVELADIEGSVKDTSGIVITNSQIIAKEPKILEYNRGDLEDGWYNLSIINAVSVDLGSPTIGAYFKNRHGKKLIDDSSNDYFKNYQYTQELIYTNNPDIDASPGNIIITDSDTLNSMESNGELDDVFDYEGYKYGVIYSKMSMDIKIIDGWFKIYSTKVLFTTRNLTKDYIRLHKTN